MRRIQLDRHTLRFQRRWTAAALAFAAVAAVAPVLAGGTDAWFRLITGALTVGGTLGACRFRNTLHLPIASALSAAALLPDDATISPAIIAGITGVAMLLCAECVAVARRLVTAASVRSVARDVRAVALVAAASIAAVLGVAALAQLGRFGGRVLVLGLPVAAVAIVIAVIGVVPTVPPTTGRAVHVDSD